MKTEHIPEKNIVFLATGSNMGDRRKNLEAALILIGESIGRLLEWSSIYETAAWGKLDQPDFYNQVVKVATALDANETMKKILEIEKQMGRRRTYKYAPRQIDIDILFFNSDIILSEGLEIPHPMIQNRNFVLAPLVEIAPAFVHPALGKSILALSKECSDLLGVKKITDGLNHE